MNPIATRTLCAAALILVSATGCRRNPPPPASETVAQPASAPTDGSAVEQPAWQRLTAPTETQQAMLLLAETGRVQLARGLMGALTEATAGGNFETAIDACRVQAPAIAEQLQTDAGGFTVRLGRTSERLRNPANVGPEWVQSALAQPDPAGAWSDGTRVGELTPIRTAALCVNCHGAADQLAPGVADAVAKLYEDDRATGFAEGDLRGWFWVEVAATP